MIYRYFVRSFCQRIFFKRFIVFVRPTENYYVSYNSVALVFFLCSFLDVTTIMTTKNNRRIFKHSSVDPFGWENGVLHLKMKMDSMANWHKRVQTRHISSDNLWILHIWWTNMFNALNEYVVLCALELLLKKALNLFTWKT